MYLHQLPSEEEERQRARWYAINWVMRQQEGALSAQNAPRVQCDSGRAVNLPMKRAFVGAVRKC